MKSGTRLRLSNIFKASIRALIELPLSFSFVGATRPLELERPAKESN
jgi:hypothetical protein